MGEKRIDQRSNWQAVCLAQKCPRNWHINCFPRLLLLALCLWRLLPVFMDGTLLYVFVMVANVTCSIVRATVWISLQEGRGIAAACRSLRSAVCSLTH